MRAILRFILRLLFGFRAYGVEGLTTPGPVLLIPNHTSWIDWMFLGSLLDLDWKFVVSSTTAQHSWLHRKIMLNRRTFPVDISSPYAVKRMAEHLQAGGRLVLFAEGQITHTGALMKLYDGTGFLLFRTRAKVVTCYLRGANRLWCSRQPGWRAWFPRVSAHFSPVLQPPHIPEVSAAVARTKATAWLRDRLVEQQFAVEDQCSPGDMRAAIAQAAREQPKKVVLEDATLQPLTYRRLFVASRLLGKQLGIALSGSPTRVGVLLPNINAMPVTLLGLWGLGKVPAVLNFSTGTSTMLACAQLAGLKQVITSRTFLTRAKLQLDPLVQAGIQLIYLEDLRAGISSLAKVLAMLRPLPGPREGAGVDTNSTAVILFTSGSEGVPKGVELTHRNLLSNIRQILAITDIEDRDRIFNALPLFHSFGLTIGTLFGLVRGLYVFLYPSPLHYRMVPAVLYDRNCTIFLATNTFLNGYARKAHPYDFRSMRYLFAAAEKVQETTTATWCQRFGVRVLEGYGATECGPCIAVNTPMSPRHGSTGKLLPGMEYRLEAVEGVSEGGRLFVRGPNVMRGYLNAEANATFMALDG